MSFWSRRKVFVTGATGLLGSWLTKRLREEGAFVVALVRDRVPETALEFSGLHIVHGELTDYHLLERALNEYEIDTVFHLGAQTIVGVANRSPISTFESNIRGTWNLLEAARNLGTAKRIVVASSDKAYGEHPDLPYTEEYPLKGLHPYDCSKSCVDLIAQCYFHTYSLPIAIARCGNLYGGGDTNLSRIVPDVIVSLLQNRRPIIRSDGTPKRDYFYIEDAVDAFLLLTENLERGDVVGQAFNFSSENPMTVLEIVKKIMELMEKEDLPPMVLGKARCEIQDQYLSCKKAREVLSWRPRFSLEEGLRRTINWYRENIENFRK